MTHELIGEYPAADDREQMGRFLRQAFPLGLGSFVGLQSVLKSEEASGDNTLEEGSDRQRLNELRKRWVELCSKQE